MTLLDFPGKVACTVFTLGCNWRCPFCHNAQLAKGHGDPLDSADLLAFLKKRQGILDGVAITGGEPTLCCHYALDNERLRDCPAENCDKKLTKEEAMKKLTQDDKQEIIRLRVEENVPVKLIAEKFHVSKSAVFSIVSEWKKHGNSAISNDEKEPDTAATVTGSEQEDLVDIPADIVTQETENVKPVDDLLPCAVVDAMADQIDRLYDKITECDREMQKIRDARANAENDLDELKAFLKKYGLGDIVKTLDLNAKWRVLQGEK